MITLEKIRDLPISAASGLVIIGDYFYVIADDEVHLSVLSLRDPNFHQRIPLFDKGVGLHLQEQMGSDPFMRKKHKPDFEALTFLPATAGHPRGALLALGSGSKRNRQRAVIIPFHADGTLSTETTTLDLSALYDALPLEDTNIEGALITTNQLVLMQRGNNRHEQSALVSVLLNSFSSMDGVYAHSTRDARGAGSAARSSGTIAADHSEVTTIHYTMPTVDGIPLGFTDGLYLPNGDILFSAVAENTDDSYNDGACVGAALGRINARGELVACELLSQPYKVEGIAMAVGDHTTLYMVTDADDPGIPAVLYRSRLPG